MRATKLNVGIREGLITEQHRRAMGEAVWLFMWIVRAQTTEAGDAGLVYGGAPVKYSQISEESGFSERSLKRWMDILRRCDYISTDRKQSGLVITVNKAKKFSTSRSATCGLSEVPTIVPRSATCGLSEVPDVALALKEEKEKGKEKERKGEESTAETAFFALGKIWDERYPTRDHGWTHREQAEVSQLFGRMSRLTVEEFCTRYRRLISSDRDYHQRRVADLRWFCSTQGFNEFMEERNGTSGQGPQPTSGTDYYAECMRKKMRVV